MHRTAHIAFAGGGLILPVRTAYDRELVFEHVAASVKHHADIGLTANGHHWRITHNSARLAICGRCSRSLRDLAYRINGQNLCGRCVRRDLI